MGKVRLNKGKIGAFQRKMNDKCEEMRNIKSVIEVKRDLGDDKSMIMRCEAVTDTFDQNPATRTKIEKPCKVSVVSTKDASSQPVDDKQLGVLFFKQVSDGDES